MSIDARARAATTELHDALLTRVPAVSDVRRRARRRRAARVTALVAVTAVIVGGGVVAGTRSSGSATRPVGTPTPAPPTASATYGLACQLDGITCVGGRIRVAGSLAVPVSFVPAPGVNTDDISPGSNNLTVRRTSGGPTSGVSIFEQPHPVDGLRDRPASALGRASAEQVATWLATRSFVEPTEPVAAEVGGLDAWRVEATLRAGATLDGIGDGGGPVAFTFLNGDGWGTGGATAVSQHLRTSYYYLVDVPRHGLVVVWVWTYDGQQQDLEALDSMVASLRLG